MARLFPVLGLALFACAVELDPEPVGDSVSLAADLHALVREIRDNHAAAEALGIRAPLARYAGWGQTKPVGPRWQYGARFPLVKFTHQGPPQVFAITTTLKPSAAFVPNPAIRFEVLAGVGSGSARWVFDARPLQQIALPATSLEVNVTAVQYAWAGGPAGGATPITDLTFAFDRNLLAGAFAAIGNVSTERATFTNRFTVAVGDSLNFVVPDGASSWKVLPNNTAAGTFNAGTQYGFVAGAEVCGVWTGTQVAAQQQSGEWLPIPANATGFTIGPVVGANLDVTVMWGLEL